MSDKLIMIDQKNRHVKECCLGKSLDKQEPYPRWIESVFWLSVTAVFAVSIFGFITIA